MRTPKFLEMYSGLPRSIYIIFIARIVNSMGRFVYPFLTFFLSDKMGLGPDVVGFYMLLSSTAYIPGSIVGGKLTDIFGRKTILILFQSLAAVAFIFCGFLGYSMLVPWLLIAASFLGGVSKPASSAMVTDLTDSENRKAAFSLLYLGINIGVAIGPMIAGFLFANYTRWIFWGDGITSLLALSLVFLLVKETKPSKEKIEESKKMFDSDERGEEGSVFSAVLRRPILLAFVLIQSILSFVYSQHSFSIPLQMTEIFGKDLSAAFYGTLMGTNAIVVLALTVPLTTLTKNFKSIFNVSLSGVLYAVGFGMIFYINSFPLFVVSTILWTMGEILSVTNTGVYIANHTPMTHRGRFNSLFSILSGTGYAIGPMVMGKFINVNGVRLVWPLLFFLGVGGAILFYGLHLVEKGVNKRVITTEE